MAGSGMLALNIGGKWEVDLKIKWDWWEVVSQNCRWEVGH